MEKRGPKKYSPLSLKFKYGDTLENLNSSKDFKSFIFEGTIKALRFAIKNNKKKISLWINEEGGEIISLKRSKFKPVLDSAIKFYGEQEQFEKCSELTKLIEKI